MTPDEIYENFKSAAGTSGQQDGHAKVTSLSTELPDHAYDVQRVVDGTQQAWSGQAAEQALNGLAPEAESLLNAGSTMSTGQNAVSGSVDGFHTAAAKVVPMPPKPQVEDPLQAIMQGKKPSNMWDQTIAYSGAAKSNTDAMTAYEQTVNGHLSSLPQINTTAPTTSSSSAMPQVNVQAPSAPSGSAGSTGGGSAHGGSSGARSAPTGYSGGSSAPGGSTGSAAAAAPSVPGGTSGGVSGSTSTSGYAGTASPVAPGTSGGVSHSPSSTGQSVGALGKDPSFSGNISGILDGEDPALPGGGSAGSGLGGARGIGAGGGGTGNSPKSAGGRSGASPISAEEQAMGRSGSVAAEKAGTGMAGGGMGGARGKGEDDEEHKRKYDINADRELFLNQDLVAPQVIGESPAEYEARIARDSGQER